jgi:UDP-GlcNAc:undecaprenyl-phosphate GlcNAc-1-phosphate transferase
LRTGFPEIIYVGAFLLAATTTAVAVPLWRLLSVRFGLIDHPGVRKIHHAPVPLAGGPGILSGIVLALGCCALLVPFLDTASLERIQYGFSHRSGQVVAILGGGLAMLSLGLLDDLYDLSPGLKFFGQVVVAFLVAASGIRITLFVPSTVFSYSVTIFWIVALVNAFNFVDNMNGLCGGLAAIAAILFGFSAALRGDYLVAGFGFLCAGAFCGFLPFNFPRATAFLGDSGSHLAGFLVAVLAILPHYYSRKHPHALAVLTPLLVLVIPLFDLVWVVLLRLRTGQPFYVGDNNHLSHRLVRRGLSPVQSVLVIWLTALMLGAVSFLL